MLDTEKVRADFPILNQKIHGNNLVYLDNAATTQKPQQVINSIIDFYSKINSNVHRSTHTLSEQASNAYENVRKIIKEFIHAKKTNEIIFTSGTTESINLIASSFSDYYIKPGDHIIISEMEHHSNIVPWQILTKEKKGRLQIIPFDNNGILKISDLNHIISDKTKLISLTHVSNVLGTINPIKEIVQIAHNHDIPVLIDGAQAIQHLPIDVQDIDCDFYVFSGHKIYAETGIGILYAKEKWLKNIPPYQYGGGMISKVSFTQTIFLDHPYKFEAGTGNISAVISLGKAIEYLTNIGLKEIHDHENSLMNYALDQLAKLPGITIYGNAPQRCSSISFNLANIHHYDAVMILDKMGIAVRSGKLCAEPVMNHYNINGCIRASITLYNSKEDINRLIRGIRKVQEMHQ